MHICGCKLTVIAILRSLRSSMKFDNSSNTVSYHTELKIYD